MVDRASQGDKTAAHGKAGRNGHTAGRWPEVSGSHPCPVCRKPDWCRASPDGDWAACRRVAEGAHEERTYEDGSAYYYPGTIDPHLPKWRPPRNPWVSANPSEYLSCQGNIYCMKRYATHDKPPLPRCEVCHRAFAPWRVPDADWMTLPRELQALVLCQGCFIRPYVA